MVTMCAAVWYYMYGHNVCCCVVRYVWSQCVLRCGTTCMVTMCAAVWYSILYVCMVTMCAAVWYYTYDHNVCCYVVQYTYGHKVCCGVVQYTVHMVTMSISGENTGTSITTIRTYVQYIHTSVVRLMKKSALPITTNQH